MLSQNASSGFNALLSVRKNIFCNRKLTSLSMRESLVTGREGPSQLQAHLINEPAWKDSIIQLLTQNIFSLAEPSGHPQSPNDAVQHTAVVAALARRLTLTLISPHVTQEAAKIAWQHPAYCVCLHVSVRYVCGNLLTQGLYSSLER